MNTTPCSVCKETGHQARRCPELSQPLQPGFYAPSGGGRYTGEDDDEKLKFAKAVQLAKWHTLDFPSLLKKPSV